jgi:hypothetical protein
MAVTMERTQQHYDRKRDDVGNIQGLDHVNLAIADQKIATIFYIMGLGYTRDPYARVGISNMGVNLGISQFHLPTASGERPLAQRLRGTIGLVVPDLKALTRRLEKVTPLLSGTSFKYTVHADRIDATCPWGNRYRCHAPAAEFGDAALGMPYVEFEVPRGTAAGIGRFYERGLLALTTMKQQGGDITACVDIGTQKLLFRETDAPLPAYDGHHIALYVANHSAPHRFLEQRNLITEESNAHQYRFRDIVDPDSGQRLYELEHEIRSLRHPLYNKPLVNRDPALE